MIGRLGFSAMLLGVAVGCTSPVYSVTGVDAVLPRADGEALVGRWMGDEGGALMVVTRHMDGDVVAPDRYAVALAVDATDDASHTPPAFQVYTLDGLTLQAGGATLVQVEAAGDGGGAGPTYPWAVSPYGFLKVEVKGKRLSVWQLVPEAFGATLPDAERAAVLPTPFGPPVGSMSPQPTMLAGTAPGIAAWLVAHAEDDAAWSDEPIEFERVGKRDAP